MLKRQYDNFLECDSSYNEADIVIVGVPFDSTTSYRPGARFAPKSVRAESYGIESFSPYQNKDLLDCKIMDSGDLEIPIGSTELTLDLVYKNVTQLLKDKKTPALIGGEHLITLGAIRAMKEFYPDLAVVQFDAHCDLREDYLGVELSHATVMRHIHSLIGDNNLYQLGIRSGDRSEFEYSTGRTIMGRFDLNILPETIRSLKGKPVYFTLDLDVLDPGVFPGTGTPEPGGISFKELLDGVLSLTELNIVGFDITELAPYLDSSGASTIVACKILRELMLLVSK